jgi:hypothetical protein
VPAPETPPQTGQQPPQQQPPPDHTVEHAALAVIVLALMSGATIEATTKTIGAVVAPLSISNEAVAAMLRMVVPHLPPLPTGPITTSTPVADLFPPLSAKGYTSRTRWARSAAYVFNGAKRVQGELDQAAGAPPRPPLPPTTGGTADLPGPAGEPGPAESLIARTRQERVRAFGESARARVAQPVLSPAEQFPVPTEPLDRALVRERRYFAQHLNAERARMDSARRVDALAGRLGTTRLGWRAVMDERTTEACRAANGRNFDVAKPPPIGYPGTLHGGTCRCVPAPPFPGQPLIDELILPRE